MQLLPIAGDEVQSLALPHELFASGATQVASGARHNLAVVHGQLYSWGWNSNGQLGRSADGALRLPPCGFGFVWGSEFKFKVLKEAAGGWDSC